MLLGDVVEADDAYTGSHSRDVVTLVLDVARPDGIDDARAERRGASAALLHDIGKIKVPGEIISKPGKLTDEEWEIMKDAHRRRRTPLSQVGGSSGTSARSFVHCHEDWDGTGYPDGLSAEDIPLVARIVSACDAHQRDDHRSLLSQGAAAEEAVAELRPPRRHRLRSVVVVEALARRSLQPT